MLQLTKTQNGRFLDDKRGNVAIIFGLAIIPVIVLMGLAIDGWRILNAATIAANAVDAAALTTARRMSQENLNDSQLMQTAQDSFAANSSGALPAGTVFRNLNVAADRGQGTVTLTVDTNLPTTFGKLARINQLSLTRSSTVSYKFNDLELGLMLDVTGSMNRNGKLRSLKTAIHDLLDQLMPEGRTANGVRIGLAPYSAAVNAGTYAEAVSNDTSNDGCVVERTGGDLDLDLAPTRTDYFRGIEEANEEIVHDTGRRGRYDYYQCPDAEVLPLSDDREIVGDTVDSYRANGRTAGHLGVAWAWYLVSPNWSSIWPGASRPEDYGKADLIKAVVLMTDGEFNAAYTGTDSRSRATDESFNRADKLCDNMKREGVVVFAIGFDLHENDAINALRDCATEDRDGKLFYQAKNEEELRKAYRDIAIRLTNLRITK
ncbi:MAG: pilus assembly protein TadG-related protein [Methyloligellaceae bacterium]